MRPFRYRPSRIKARLAIEFQSDSTTLHGTSQDISTDGLRCTLNGSLTAGARGHLLIHTAKTSMDLEVVATYVHQNVVAFAFFFKSSWERNQLSSFVLSLSPRNVPFHRMIALRLEDEDGEDTTKGLHV